MNWVHPLIFFASIETRVSLAWQVSGRNVAAFARGPTHHSTEPARKAAQFGEFKRWVSADEEVGQWIN